MHLRILRSELVAACPVIFALMILIAIGRRAHLARPLGMALAAALCVLGLENKVQAILLIGVLPFLILPFGSAQSASVASGGRAQAGSSRSIAAIVALAAVVGGMAADMRPASTARCSMPRNSIRCCSTATASISSRCSR